MCGRCSEGLLGIGKHKINWIWSSNWGLFAEDYLCYKAMEDALWLLRACVMPSALVTDEAVGSYQMAIAT